MSTIELFHYTTSNIKILKYIFFYVVEKPQINGGNPQNQVGTAKPKPQYARLWSEVRLELVFTD